MISINYFDLLKQKLNDKLKDDMGYQANIANTKLAKSIFTFTSFEENAGLNIKKYYDDLLKNKNEIELRLELKKVKSIQINNTNIDQLLIDTLSAMFGSNDLEFLKIRNCNIKANCCLTNLKIDKIIISDSNIDNFNFLNLTKSDLQFFRCNIESISNLNIFSKKIEFFEAKIDFYKLFLMSNFPNLDYLMIKAGITYDGYSSETKNLKNSFLYLPYSCPNISKLRIEAVVDDLDFLVRLTKLTNVSIVSTFESMNAEALRINDKEKLKRLEIKNHEQVEIKKILHGVFNELDNIKYITRSEIDRIIDLNDFFKTISFTKEEMNALINQYKFVGNYLDMMINFKLSELKGYYTNYYDKLIYNEIDENELFYIFSNYKLIYKYGYIYLDKKENEIVVPKNFIFYIDGKPIILNKCEKRIVTIEDAKNFVASQKKYYEEIDDAKIYIEGVRALANETKSSISLSLFSSVIFEIYGINLNVIYKDVLDKMIGDKGLIFKLHKDNDAISYANHIKKLYEKNIRLLSKLIYNKFKLFTKEELLAIINILPYKDHFDMQYLQKYIDKNLVNDEIIGSINLKCDFKFLKLLDSISRLKQIETEVDRKRNEYLLTENDIEKLKQLKVKTKSRFKEVK